MRLAFGPLHLTPDTFWRMSPQELQAALDGHAGDGMEAAGRASPGRQEFDALCAQYPDQGVEDAADG
ncbi:MAG: phage tail assembly chaperone [Alphaproteobacteria bacterium]